MYKMFKGQPVRASAAPEGVDHDLGVYVFLLYVLAIVIVVIGNCMGWW